jgi:hypothetical protein
MCGGPLRRTVRRTVGRVREERGQTGGELLGVLLVVSLIVGALSSTGVAATVADETSRLVCAIGGGDCEAAPPPAPPAGLDPPDGGEPPAGPPLEGQDIPVLPFPGSVTVTCTFASGQSSACDAPDGPGVSVRADASTTVSRSDPTFDPEGCPLVRLGVSTKLELAVGGSAERGRASGSLEAHLGESTSYTVTVSPGAAEDIADGERPTPNPVDPTTIADGESVLLSEEYYAGIGLSGSYRALQASLGYDRGTRVSSGVQRVSPSTVRVLVGDEDFVRQTLSLGLGVDGASISLGGTEQLSSGQLHAVDIDISTSAGWQAYQDFLASGELPRDGVAGTTNPTDSEVVSYSDQTSAEVEVGPVTVGGLVGSSEGRRIDTTDADGNVTSLFTSRYNSVGLVIQASRDADGNATGDPSYALTFLGADETLLENLRSLDGGDGSIPEDGNGRIDFTAGDLEEMRELALGDLRDQVALNGGDPSIEDIAASLEDGDGVVDYDGVEYAFDPWITGIASAATPEEILVALYTYGGAQSPNGLLQQLGDLLLHQDAELPGELAAPDCD